jgi:NAD(P)-dependent dehydrogenase (short-subunit alcohol dehydrogenase family)
MSYPGLNLDGRVAVVIGGTSGIGRAITLGLAEAGADVIASARGADNLEATAAEIEARGRRTLRVRSDVADRASLDALRDAVLAGFGRVDILVNCAGTTRRTPTLDLSEAEWNSILDTNLTGTLRGCQAFGRPMLAQGYGRIINIASLSSFVGLYEVAAYAASKAGVASGPRSTAGCSTARRAARSSCCARRCGGSAGSTSSPGPPCSSHPTAPAS